MLQRVQVFKVTPMEEFCGRCGVEFKRSIEGYEYDALICPECHATKVVLHSEPGQLPTNPRRQEAPSASQKPPKLVKAVAWSSIDEDRQPTSAILCVRCKDPNPNWQSYLRCIRCQNEIAAGEPEDLVPSDLSAGARHIRDICADC